MWAGKASQYPTIFTVFDSRSKSDREPPFPYGQFSGVCVCLMWKSMGQPYKEQAYDHTMRSLLATMLAVASVTPPVIHEPFHALPCPLHPDTTIDVEGCQERRVLRTDRQIDAQVKAILRLLRTDSIRATFVTGERSWLHYRRQSCAAEASHLSGGTEHGVAFLSCTLQRNRAHLTDLGAMRKALGSPS